MNNSIKNNINCSGCGVCKSICPKNAITFETNSMGFSRPLVNDTCIECGLCVKKCHEYKIYNGYKIKKAYTAFSQDTYIRNNSSSGGVFSEIAIQAIANGGFVCAAGFDKTFKLHHQIVDSLKELDGLRKSKYLESDTVEIWDQLKKRIKKDTQARGIFVGTPCQCNALHSYLGEMADNILVVDFICHGVASPAIFEKYKNYLSQKFGAPRKIDFRHKENGNDSYFLFEGESGKYMIPNYTESYPYAYASGLIIADDCTHCKYCSLERYSDITLGDYVGDNTDYSKSTIFVNTEKGEEILQQCNNLMLIEADMNSIISKSWHLTTPNSYNPNRAKVFSLLDKPWDYLEKKFFHKPSRFQLYKEAIVKKIYKLIHI